MVGEAKPEAGRILRQGQRRRISFYALEGQYEFKGSRMHRKESMSLLFPSVVQMSGENNQKGKSKTTSVAPEKQPPHPPNKKPNERESSK